MATRRAHFSKNGGLAAVSCFVPYAAHCAFARLSALQVYYTTFPGGPAHLTPFCKTLGKNTNARLPQKGKAGTRAVVKEEEKRIDLCRNFRLCRKVAGCRRAALMQSSIAGGPACFVPLCSGLLPAHGSLGKPRRAFGSGVPHAARRTSAHGAWRGLVPCAFLCDVPLWQF